MSLNVACKIIIKEIFWTKALSLLNSCIIITGNETFLVIVVKMNMKTNVAISLKGLKDSASFAFNAFI